MTEDQDHAGEVVAATVRVALTAAGQLAEQAARRREAALREAGRESAVQVATLQSQLSAERQIARHSVREVLQRGNRASVEEFAQAWQQIGSWDDPVAAADRDLLRAAVRERFGVDPDGLSGKAAPVASARTPDRDVPAAAAMLDYDAVGQGGDAQHRASSSGHRDGDPAGQLNDGGFDVEITEAKALAALSHPTSPTLAARPPASTSRAQRRSGKRKAGLEVQNRGR